MTAHTLLMSVLPELSTFALRIQAVYVLAKGVPVFSSCYLMCSYRGVRLVLLSVFATGVTACGHCAGTSGAILGEKCRQTV